MKKNIGKRDRVFRFALATVLAILAYANVVPERLDLALYILAGLMALTGFTRVCLLYKPLGISTCNER